MIVNDMIEQYYQALISRDASYEGKIVAGVKTTGVFCRLTCRARKPKKENVEFFSSVNEAVSKGYRPCKICEPLKPAGRIPDYIKIVLDEISKDFSIKLKDRDLRSLGIEPNKVRRWFANQYGITFHLFQRTFLLKHALQRIQNGESVTFVAFDSGYESLSGFNEAFKSVFGVSPSCVYRQKVKLKSVC